MRSRGLSAQSDTQFVLFLWQKTPHSAAWTRHDPSSRCQIARIGSAVCLCASVLRALFWPTQGSMCVAAKMRVAGLPGIFSLSLIQLCGAPKVARGEQPYLVCGARFATSRFSPAMARYATRVRSIHIIVHCTLHCKKICLKIIVPILKVFMHKRCEN